MGRQSPEQRRAPPPRSLTLVTLKAHCIRADTLPTSLSTFLLFMSARQERLRRMLDTT